MRHFLLLFLLSSLAFASYEEIEDRSQLTIDTPSLAQRETQKLRLENGLEVLIISDPNTPQSGAALAVNVGSWEDPQDRPGMAHFVEHLLFLGTEKYPEEEGYSSYLDENGGMRNAFTMADRTVYMFSVNNAGFDEALDRFGHFFIAPLFTPSGVARECKAIHQEYCKYVPVDPWRVLHVKMALANPKHPFHNFSIGNKDTLAKISQDELKEWYYNHYSSNLMHLVVYSPEPIETLREKIVPLFSQVKNLDREVVSEPAPLFEKRTPQMVCVAPIQQVQMLELSWELPRFFGTDQKFQTDKLVSYVLGHEGETSLLAQLKREHLAEGLSTSTHRSGRDQCMLTINVHLTSKGIRDYPIVTQRVFEAIASLKQSGIPRYIFEEIAQIQEADYRFQSREEIFQLVMSYAMCMVDEPIDTFPRQSLIPSDYAPEKVAELIDVMSCDNCFFTLVVDPQISGYKPTQKELWLGSEYTVLDIPQKVLTKWEEAKPHKQICIPAPNRFVAQDLSVVVTQPTEELPTPKLVHESKFAKIYSCHDERFGLPNVCWKFILKTPLVEAGVAKSQVLADLFCHCCKEQLNQIAYEAELANLHYTLEPAHNGLQLKIEGYGDKAPDYLSTVVDQMRALKVSREHFTLYKELAFRQYSNQNNHTAMKTAREVVFEILYKDYATLEQKQRALAAISFKDLATFSQKIWEEGYIEASLYGHFPQSVESAICQQIEEKLFAKPYLLEKQERPKLARLSDESRPHLVSTQSYMPQNAVILTLDCGDFSFEKRAAHEVLSKALEEPFFSELRTRQQTAYLVTNWAQEIERRLYSFFAIQSSSHNTRDLLARFELFLETHSAHPSEALTFERFDAIRTATIERLERPAENVSSMGNLLAGLAFDYEGDFAWIEKRKQALRDLTYEEFLEHTRCFMGKENRKRFAVLVDGDLPNLSYEEAPNPKSLSKQIIYQSRIES